MESNNIRSHNGTHLYRDEGFNTFSVTLNFLAHSDNKSAAVLDVLCVYLMLCNQVYKTEGDINLKLRELYNMEFYFNNNWYGNQKIFYLYADIISMDVVNDDYSTEAFEFIRDMLLKPDFEKSELLELAKKKVMSYVDINLSDNGEYATSLYNQTVLPIENKKYDCTVDKQYVENLVNSVTLEDLKKEYNYLIGNYISGLVLGNISDEKFDKLIKYIDLNQTIDNLDYSVNVKTTEGDIEVCKDCSQSYIYVTYDFTDLTQAQMRVLSRILNSSIGLCMQTLREKYGLVYGAYASILFHEKKLYIYGETDASKKQKFIEACDEIIASLSNRELLEKYMKQAKEEIANDEYSLSENKDQLINTMDIRFLKFYGDQDREIVNNEIENMLPEELMNKTKTLTRKNVFMLRGKTNE